MEESLKNPYSLIAFYSHNNSPLVKLNEPVYMGDFGDGSIPPDSIKSPFFSATPDYGMVKKFLTWDVGGPIQETY